MEAPALKPVRPARTAPVHTPVVKTPRPARKPRPSERARSADAQQKAVRESVRRTLARIETTRRTKRHKGKARQETDVISPAVKIHEGATVRELAESFKLGAPEVLKKCLDLGVTATINQTLDRELIELVAEDLGMDIQFV